MNYDFDYFSGRYLIYPTKPKKPVLPANPRAADAREFADQLEVYETEQAAFREHLDWYNSQIASRQQELCDRLRDDYDITEAQLNVIWRQAWEDGHAYGLREVVSYFERYYEMAAEFAALEKG